MVRKYLYNKHRTYKQQRVRVAEAARASFFAHFATCHPLFQVKTCLFALNIVEKMEKMG